MKLPIIAFVLFVTILAVNAQIQQSGTLITAGISPFSCTAIGYFPDVTNVNRYLYCTAPGNVAARYQCPDNYVYNSKLFTCQLLNVPIDCHNADGRFVPFAVNSAYYAWCSATPALPPTIFKCDNDVDEYFSTVTNKCEFRCRTIGNFADRMDCTRYYTCDTVDGGVWGEFIAIRQQCPATYHYSQHMCLPDGPQRCRSLAETEKPAAPK